ncbi:ASKHA domain-containing protein [Alsobacter sp. SYSU M60028]|uniref:ASKHA domain-containing protein n=1 Tax=Alsobacter ponti TaxID=2962936 RepID=A0ABT1LFD5_9HYPH|nr:ASKHA domain-containing protein [Alsobacter ponti]MCP8940217.1 ASKHA domain-containing protein [Alsobacter ponti]
MADHLVVFTPSGKRGRFAEGTPVLEAARQLGVDLDSVCGGRGICGRCQVEIGEGTFSKHGIESGARHVTAWNAVEARYAAKRGALANGRRLGCQARVTGDLVVDVPPDSQVHRQVVRKRAEAHPIEIDPVVRLAFVEVAQPDMHDPASDFRRLQAALAAQWGVEGVTASLPVLATLQATLHAGEWSVTAALRGREIVALWPGLRERAHGMAVDVGSTTIAAHLTDLITGEVVASAGLMNPQIRFGEDLMSRVSYVMMNPGGERELTSSVREALDRLVGDVVAEAGIDRADVLEMTVVGNPIMHHLLLGLNPVELGGAPFALTIDGAYEVPARDLGIVIAPGAYVYALPCIAGHVGADTAGVVLSEGPYLKDELTLLVDVGTNAEIVLGNRQRLLACSSPTGPAFEGAQISCGQRAAPGAIERVRIDRQTLEPRYKVIGCDLWSNEPGFEEATASTGVTGICGSGIIEIVAEMWLSGIITTDGVIDGGLAERSPRIEATGRTFSYLVREGEPRLSISQNDVRAIQLAKAALYAGIRLLMDRYGVDKVERITLAGAFGSHIDVRYAMVLGLIPDCDLSRVASAGNAAGTGARIALLNLRSRAEIEKTVLGIEKIETALEPAFQEHFVNAMAIPNKVEPFPELAKVVEFPTPRESVAESGGRRRRRRDG